MPIGRHDHTDEARERWGDTDAWRESTRRTEGYGPEQWRAIRAESDTISEQFATLYEQDAAAGSDEAMDAAEAHREHIERWFYDCPPAMHRGLGAMYVTDLRFTEHWDERAPGLAAYVRDAFAANADRQGEPTPQD
jgi:hypothetical protein